MLDISKYEDKVSIEEKEIYKTLENTINKTINGMFIGIQKGYVVDVPDFGSFKLETGIRGMYPIYCNISPDMIYVHLQKYNEDKQEYQPYDWENEEWIPFDKFKNYKPETPDGLFKIK